MRKRLLTVIAIVMAMSVCVVMTGCGFDPCAYVNGQMELLQTGKATDEAVANTDGTKEELEADYQEAIEDFADAFFKASDGTFEDNDANRAKLKEVFTALMSSMKYKVSDEYTEKDDSYFVDVEVEGSKLFDKDVLEKWAEDWANEHFAEFSSSDEIYKAFWPAYCDYIIDNAKTAGNEAPKTVTLELALDKDSGLYQITDESENELINSLFTGI